MPERQQRIQLAAAQRLAQQRRRGVLHAGSGEIDALLRRGALQQQPAEAVRPTGDADALAAQIGQRADRATAGTSTSPSCEGENGG